MAMDAKKATKSVVNQLLFPSRNPEPSIAKGTFELPAGAIKFTLAMPFISEY